MPDFAWALLLKPFVLLLLAVVVLTPARRYVERRMRDGKLKKLLLTRVN